MGKLFLLILFGIVVYLLLKRGKRPAATPPSAPSTETMIRCAHCLVHVPLSESVADSDARYCCEEHRRLGRR